MTLTGDTETVTELTDLFDVSRSTVYRATRRGGPEIESERAR